MDAALFVTHFPEFADAPEGQIAFWSDMAEKRLPRDRWGDMWENGVELFTAHHLVLAGANAQAAAVGGQPGGQQGGITGKTVDKVSISYDVNNVVEAEGGHWNETTYGRMFLRLARLIGTGGVQL